MKIIHAFMLGLESAIAKAAGDFVVRDDRNSIPAVRFRTAGTIVNGMVGFTPCESYDRHYHPRLPSGSKRGEITISLELDPFAHMPEHEKGTPRTVFVSSVVFDLWGGVEQPSRETMNQLQEILDKYLDEKITYRKFTASVQGELSVTLMADDRGIPIGDVGEFVSFSASGARDARIENVKISSVKVGGDVTP